MADADLGEAGAGDLELAHHLDADHAGRRRSARLGRGAGAGSGGSRSRCRERAGRTAAARRGGRSVRSPCGTTASPRPELVALDDVDVGPGGVDAADELGGVVLGVAVGVEDPIARWPRRSRRAAPRRSPGCARARRCAARGSRRGAPCSTATESSLDPSSTTMISKSSTLAASAPWTSRTIFGMAGRRCSRGRTPRSDRTSGLRGVTRERLAAPPTTCVDLVVGELGEARQRDALRRPRLGLRARAVGEVPVRRLLGQGERVVDRRGDTPVGEHRRARVRGRSTRDDALVDDVVAGGRRASAVAGAASR